MTGLSLLYPKSCWVPADCACCSAVVQGAGVAPCTRRNQGSLAPQAPAWSPVVVTVCLPTLVKTALPEARLSAFCVYQTNVIKT